jgi:hypothetical protein
MTEDNVCLKDYLNFFLMTRVFLENLKEGEHLLELSVDGRITLQGILKCSVES